MSRPLVAAALLALASCGAPGLPPSSPSPLVGKPAPVFRRQALDGATIDTAAFQGKTVVYKLFADYCEPCKRTLPAFEKFHQEHPQVVFVGISEDESEEKAQGVVRLYRLSFPVVFDRENVLAGRLRTSEMPSTFIVDRTGTVRWYGDSRQNEEQLTRAIEAIDRGP